jgi:uncharacterized repeat protein (TIGR03803 family)
MSVSMIRVLRSTRKFVLDTTRKAMDGQVSLRNFRFNVNSRVSMSAMALAMICALTLLTTHAAQAQTFSVLHYFTGGADGAIPYAGVTVGPSGVLYGTATTGGTHNHGTVFKLSQTNSSWVFSTLHEFTGGSDGAAPYGGAVFGPNGALYGTTNGGGANNYGTVFELRPPPTFCRSVLCYWNETILYNFMGTPDGEYAGYGNLAFDPAGDIYGTTADGGIYGDGTTFELTPSGGGYTESILHNFGSGTDGTAPYAGVVLDTAGNVYGTTISGGTGTECEGGCGTVYQLMPSNGGWVENVLVNFNGANGIGPFGNLIIDASGNLYGTTTGGGQAGSGVVFKLAPSDGGFTYSALYSFGPYCQSYGGVAMDAAGNFFGGCTGGFDYPSWVFELTNCSRGCTEIDLHNFGGNDGYYPSGAPVLDANGNLYGTTQYGGTGDGVVWEIAGVGARHQN